MLPPLWGVLGRCYPMHGSFFLLSLIVPDALPLGAVLSRLMAVFPRIQFLVSTHSPEALSTFNKEHIRVVRNGSVILPELQTSGVPSDRILSHVMGVDPVWGELEAAKMLSRYHSLISQGNESSEEAGQIRSRLADHYGKDSQQIMEWDKAINIARIRKKISGHNQSQL